MHFLRSKSTVDNLTVFHAFRRKPSLQWVPLRGKYPPFSSKLKQAKFKAISLNTPFLYKSYLLHVRLSIANWVQLWRKELKFIWILCKRLCFSQFRLLFFIFSENLVWLNVFSWCEWGTRSELNVIKRAVNEAGITLNSKYCINIIYKIQLWKCTNCAIDITNYIVSNFPKFESLSIIRK